MSQRLIINCLFFNKMKYLHPVAFILVIVGGLNWLLEALGWNLVYTLLGSWPTLERLVYILVGLSAVYLIFEHKKTCRRCGTDASVSAM